MPIFKSAGCVVLHVVFSTGCCGCGPKEPVRTTATTPRAEHHMQQHTTCTPEDGHIDVRNM